MHDNQGNDCSDQDDKDGDYDRDASAIPLQAGTRSMARTRLGWFPVCGHFDTVVAGIARLSARRGEGSAPALLMICSAPEFVALIHLKESHRDLDHRSRDFGGKSSRPRRRPRSGPR